MYKTYPKVIADIEQYSSKVR